MLTPDLPDQNLEATARQCRADALAAEAVHSLAAPDRRELLLNELVERSLETLEGFKRIEDDRRRAWAEGAEEYKGVAHARLRRTGRIHLELGRSLISQLDQAATDRLTVRNAISLRRAYAELVDLEALDHGAPSPLIVALAHQAEGDFSANRTQEIDPDDRRNGVDSHRTWDFIKRTTSLPEPVQRLAEKRYRSFFAIDDRHPALGGHPLMPPRHGEGAVQLWSVEISFAYRALAVLTESTGQPRRYVWFWIGSPDQTRSPG